MDDKKKIVDLTGKSYTPTDEKSEPCQKVIDKLEELLKQAKVGTLQELSYVAIKDDDTKDYGIIGIPIDPYATFSSLSVLTDYYMRLYLYPQPDEEYE